jgi:hypothetical protein
LPSNTFRRHSGLSAVEGQNLGIYFIIFSGLPEMAMIPLKTPLHSVRTATVKHIMAILRLRRFRELTRVRFPKVTRLTGNQACN